MTWSREQLRQMPLIHPHQVLRDLEIQFGESEVSRRGLPVLTLWLEGGFQIRGDFLRYHEGEGLLIRPTEPSPTVDLLVVPPDRIVGLLLHYEDSRVRRLLRARPDSAGLTGFTLRREMESWANKLRTQFGLTAHLEVSWDAFATGTVDDESLPYLREGLTELGRQLEAIAETEMGLEALSRLKTIIVCPGNTPSFSIQRNGAVLTYRAGIEDELPVWPTPPQLRQALEKVL